MKEFEIMKEINTEEEAKDWYRYAINMDVTGATNAYITMFPDKKKVTNFVNTRLYEDITLQTNNLRDMRLLDKAFTPYKEDFKSINGEDIKCFVPNQNGKSYIKKNLSNLEEAAKKIEGTIDEMVKENDEVGLKIKEYLKTVSSQKLYNASKGYSEDTMSYKIPLTTGINCISACLINDYSDDKLRRNISKWQYDFPVYDMVIESGKMNKTILDYLQESEKKPLTEERENEYRQKLYDHIITIRPLFNKVMSSVENPELHDALKADGITDKTNDPFHIHPISVRGSSGYDVCLEAYQIGLENGWPIRDITFLASFNKIIQDAKHSATTNRAMDMNKLEKYAEDDLRYKSPEHKAYIEQMAAYFEKIKNTKINTKEQRDELINGIYEFIDDGVKKNYIDNNTRKYFVQCAKVRNNAIASIGGPEKDPGVASKVEVGEERKIALMTADLNAKRTDMWFGSENDEHKNLRLSVENLQKFYRENKKPADNASMEEKVKYNQAYLGKLDAVQHYSKIYQESRKGASTLGGQQRLRGSQDFDAFVSKEKYEMARNMISPDAKNVPEERINEKLQEIRRNAANDKLVAAYNNITSLNAMPTDAQGKRQLINDTADILVGRISSSANDTWKKAIGGMGIDVFRNEVINSKEFKNVMKKCLTDKTMTPEKLMENLTDDKILNSVREIGDKLNKKAQEIDKKEKMKKDAEKKRRDAAAKKVAKNKAK